MQSVAPNAVGNSENQYNIIHNGLLTGEENILTVSREKILSATFKIFIGIIPYIFCTFYTVTLTSMNTDITHTPTATKKFGGMFDYFIAIPTK